MNGSFIISAVRTPIGRHAGVLAQVRPDDLAAAVLAEAVGRAGVNPECIDEVVFGATNQAGEDNRNVARMAILLAGLPQSVPGFTVNRLCASGLTAVATAHQMIASGAADIVVAGGVESMTRAPWVTEKPSRAFAKPGATYDTSIGWRFPNPRFDAMTTMTMPRTAEEVARRENLDRKTLDEFALRSHRLATAAIDAGRFESEILTVATAKGSVAQDEGPRRNTSLEVLANLPPVVMPGGVITAGNSSSLNDGAAAVVVASSKAVAQYELMPRARIVDGANVGVAPEVMGLGPIPATQKALARAGWRVSDLDAVELNEAFASQAVACIRTLGLDPEMVNSDGGAIALGHPLGCSGTRLIVTLLGRLERAMGRRGLATMCVGVGQGSALLIELV